MRFLIKTKTIISASVLALSLLVNSIFLVQAGENCTYFAHPSDLVTDDLDDFIADPVEGSYWSWDFYKNEALRYYYNVLCEATEPPSTDPAIYDCPSNTIPVGLIGYIPDDHRCDHVTDRPPDPSGPVPPRAPETTTFFRDEYDHPFMTNFLYSKLGLADLVNLKFSNPDPSISRLLIRNENLENPGNYIVVPRACSEVPVAPEDKAFLSGLLGKYMAPEYYTESIIDSIRSIFIIEQNRKEFFFETKLNNTRFRYSGWYNEFAHIFVYTDIGSKDDFINAANNYFNLPELDVNDVSYELGEITEENPDFFYSYNKPDVNFKLVAYPNLKTNITEDSMGWHYDGVILDLTVYPEKE